MNPAFAYRKVEADEDFVRKTAYFGKCIGSPLRASVGLTISMNLRLRTLAINRFSPIGRKRGEAFLSRSFPDKIKYGLFCA
jgi:hypothetical protein